MSRERPNLVDNWIFGNPPWGDDINGANPMNDWIAYVAEPQKSAGLSIGLTKILYTFWDVYRWPVAVTRNDPFALTNKTLNQTTRKLYHGLTMNKTKATTMRQIPIYQASPGWVACLLVCSTILLLFRIFSFFLSFVITAPDAFDHVSSFTRDNPFIDVPPGGSSLDGAGRARRLRDLPVQLGDADAGADIGNVTIRSVDGRRDRERGKTRKDRMYR